MEAVNHFGLLSRILRARDARLCPECGAIMREADRLCENGVIFVWYRCSKNECAGQWLQKMAQTLAGPVPIGGLAGAF